MSAVRSERKLIEGSKKAKVLGSLKPPMAVSVRTLEAEQAAETRRRAVRLFCRALIRLYLEDHGKPENGKSLGIL